MPSARGSQVCAPGSRVIYSQRGAIAHGGRSACDLCALNAPTNTRSVYPHPETPIQKRPRGLDSSEVRPAIVHTPVTHTGIGVSTTPQSVTPMARAPQTLLLSWGCLWHRFHVLFMFYCQAADAGTLALPIRIFWQAGAYTLASNASGGVYHPRFHVSENSSRRVLTEARDGRAP